MLPLCKGRYVARLATSAQDIDHAQALRHLCFVANRGLVTSVVTGPQTDADAYDARCQHIIVEDRMTHQTLCCYRLLHLPSGAGIASSYSAQFYDLTRLAAVPGPMLELGRFCLHPDHRAPDILRLAWAALTRLVDETGAQMLFGCSSFDGANPTVYRDTLAFLKDAHLAPGHWRPGTKSPHAYPFSETLRDHHPDAKHALASMPPLLRTYLAMGGWVSDHAVIDQDLNTLHVFTGLDIATIPPARARLLRALAA
jgi:L-ornithine Nalpha-acyltransferase